MKTLILLLCTTLAIGAFFVLLFARHREQTIDRLVNTGLVKNASSVELIYSTGYLRDNSHLFRTDLGNLLSADKGGPELTKIDITTADGYADIAPIKQMVDEHVKETVDWATAEVFAGEGKGLLSEVFVIKVKDEAFIGLRVF